MLLYFVMGLVQEDSESWCLNCVLSWSWHYVCFVPSIRLVCFVFLFTLRSCCCCCCCCCIL